MWVTEHLLGGDADDDCLNYLNEYKVHLLKLPAIIERAIN